MPPMFFEIVYVLILLIGILVVLKSHQLTKPYKYFASNSILSKLGSLGVIACPCCLNDTVGSFVTVGIVTF